MDCERVREPRFPVVACMLTSFLTLTRWAGWLELVRCDRGTRSSGVFGSTLTKNGVAIRLAGLEAPEQIGGVERRGSTLKKMMSKGIKDTHASGRESMDMILSECPNAAMEMARHGGCGPAQWVLSRLRNPTTMDDESRCGCFASACRWTNNLRCAVTLGDRTMGLWRTGQTRRFVKGRTCGWIPPSWRYCLVLQRSTSR